MALAETIMNTAGDSKEILGPIVLAASVAGTLVKSVTFIGRNELGIRTKFGLPTTNKDGSYRVAQPGPRVTVPFTHSILKVDVADRSTELDAITFDRDAQRIARPIVIWGIRPDGDSLVKSQFEVEDGELGQVVKGICEGGIFDALRGVDEADFERPDCRATVETAMVEACGDMLTDRYGVEIRRLNIHLAKTLGQKLVDANLSGQPPGLVTAVIDPA